MSLRAMIGDGARAAINIAHEVAQLFRAPAARGEYLRELEHRSKAFVLLRDEVHRIENCIGEECEVCGVLHCPHLEPLHFHHDGCPACDMPPDFQSPEEVRDATP